MLEVRICSPVYPKLIFQLYRCLEKIVNRSCMATIEKSDSDFFRESVSGQVIVCGYDVSSRGLVLHRIVYLG